MSTRLTFERQTVFGEGGTKPRVMLIGEQPGDQEDIQGHPFIVDLKRVHEALEKAA
jgi:DNA polymerase